MIVQERHGRGRHVCHDYRDPHLCYAQPVDVMESALPYPECQFKKLARYWYEPSTPPGKAWIVVFTYGREGWAGSPVLADVWGISVSQRPADPPPMPRWAIEIAA